MTALKFPGTLYREGFVLYGALCSSVSSHRRIILSYVEEENKAAVVRIYTKLEIRIMIINRGVLFHLSNIKRTMT